MTVSKLAVMSIDFDSSSSLFPQRDQRERRRGPWLNNRYRHFPSRAPRRAGGSPRSARGSPAARLRQGWSRRWCFLQGQGHGWSWVWLLAPVLLAQPPHACSGQVGEARPGCRESSVGVQRRHRAAPLGLCWGLCSTRVFRSPKAELAPSAGLELRTAQDCWAWGSASRGPVGPGALPAGEGWHVCGMLPCLVQGAPRGCPQLSWPVPPGAGLKRGGYPGAGLASGGGLHCWRHADVWSHRASPPARAARGRSLRLGEGPVCRLRERGPWTAPGLRVTRASVQNHDGPDCPCIRQPACLQGQVQQRLGQAPGGTQLSREPGAEDNGLTLLGTKASPHPGGDTAGLACTAHPHGTACGVILSARRAHGDFSGRWQPGLPAVPPAL